MKKITLITISFLIIILVFFFAVSSMAGCNKTPKQLDVCVWEGYLPEEVAALFEKETGIKLNITLINDNDKMVTLLKGGGKADIVMPTHNNVVRFYEAGLAQPIDLKNIKNYEKVSKSLREQPWTKWDGSQIGTGEIYAIPYVYGTSGLVVNTSKYTKSLDGIGWDVLLDTDLKGRVSTKNGIESLGILLDLNGIARENLMIDTLGTLDKIRDKSLALRDNVLKFYDTGSEIMDLMKNEEVWISYIWDGGGRGLTKFDAKFKYVLPKTGGVAWTDTFMIPKSASNPTGANLFIDFMLRPEIAAKVIEQSSYNTTVEGALDMTKNIDKNLYKLTDEQISKLIWLPNYSEKARSICTAFWEEISTIK